MGHWHQIKALTTVALKNWKIPAPENWNTSTLSIFKKALFLLIL